MLYPTLLDAAIHQAISLVTSPVGLAIIGAIVGSFINVVVYRLPTILQAQWRQDACEFLELAPSMQSPSMSLAWPGSRCPNCNHAIAWHENIPIFSWIALKGRCSACAAPISWRYPLMEALCAGMFAACSMAFGPHLSTLAWCGFIATLLAAAAIDWDTTLLPDSLTFPLLWAGLACACWGLIGTNLHDAVVGACAGYLSLWTLYWIMKIMTGNDAMGYGDFKLLAAIGAWLGWHPLSLVVFIASIVAVASYGVLKMSRGLTDGLYVPYGPGLAVAASGLLLYMGRDGPAALGWMLP